MSKQGNRKKNYLLKVKCVQKLYREHKHEGVTDVWVWETYIYPAFYISQRTFREYLTIRASTLLKDLDNC
jgi:hypothetical protein